MKQLISIIQPWSLKFHSVDMKDAANLSTAFAN